MEPETPTPEGFLNALRSLGDGLLASVQQRFELFVVELQEQKLRLLQTYIWVSAALFAGAMALIFTSLTVVYLFWEGARLAVLGGMALLYGLALVVIILTIRRRSARRPKPFAATIQQIKEDRACILPGN